MFAKRREVLLFEQSKVLFVERREDMYAEPSEVMFEVWFAKQNEGSLPKKGVFVARRHSFDST